MEITNLSREFIKKYLRDIPQSGDELSWAYRLGEALHSLFSDQETKISTLASKLNVSERQLRRMCHLLFEMSPNEILSRYRIRVAKDFIANGKTINLAALNVGFATHSHFSTQFKKYEGCPPSIWRKKTK